MCEIYLLGHCSSVILSLLSNCCNVVISNALSQLYYFKLTAVIAQMSLHSLQVCMHPVTEAGTASGSLYWVIPKTFTEVSGVYRSLDCAEVTAVTMPLLHAVSMYILPKSLSFSVLYL